jgi:hypothetical protein
MSYNFSDFTLNDHGFMDLTLDDNPHRLPQEQEQTVKCDICYEPLYNNKICTGDNCSHIFHCDCLRIWINESNSCPLCRAILINNQNVELKAIPAVRRQVDPVDYPPMPDMHADQSEKAMYLSWLSDNDPVGYLGYKRLYPNIPGGGYSKLNLFSYIVLIMIIAYLLFKLVMNTKLNVYRQNYQF